MNAAKILLALGAFALLAGCGRPIAESDAQPDVESAVLAPLEADDAAGLEGELGCAFHAEQGVLMLGRANVGPAEHAFAAVRHDGQALTLESRESGGFGAMERGMIFSNGPLTARVELGPAREMANEQVSHDATLVVSHALDERAYEGAWTCGP